MNYENYYHIKNEDGSKGAEIIFDDIEFISVQNGKSVQEMYTFK